MELRRVRKEEKGSKESGKRTGKHTLPRIALRQSWLLLLPEQAQTTPDVVVNYSVVPFEVDIVHEDLEENWRSKSWSIKLREREEGGEKRLTICRLDALPHTYTRAFDFLNGVSLLFPCRDSAISNVHSAHPFPLLNGAKLVQAPRPLATPSCLAVFSRVAPPQLR